MNQSSRGGLEVELWTDNSTISISVGSNPARRQKNFRSNSNTMGGALFNNVKKKKKACESAPACSLSNNNNIALRSYIALIL